jgi:hypothetical protein
MTLAALEDAHASIAVALIHRCDPSHRNQRRRVAFDTPRTILQD